MGRQPCCDKVGLKKGPWTAEEDKKLINFILTNGQCCWRAVPKLAGLLRCGKSCRLRWTNYLRPDLKRGLLSESEEQIVIDLHARLGNRWSKIAAQLPGRTDNEIKNHWNTHIRKKLKKMGIDPLTHRPLDPTSAPAPPPQAPASAADAGTGSDPKQPPPGIVVDDSFTAAVASADSPDFCTDEVPMVQPDEIIVPCGGASASISPSCSSSSSSSSSSVNPHDHQLPWGEYWPPPAAESINSLWGLMEADGHGWDDLLICDIDSDGGGCPAVDPAAFAGDHQRGASLEHEYSWNFALL